MFNKDSNPYYCMLMRGDASRRKDRQKRRIRWLLLLIVIAILPLVLNEALLVSVCCGYLLMFLPVVIAGRFAQSTALNTLGADYELVMITPLEDEDIVWGHFYSILDRHLLSRQFPYGLVPVAFVLIIGSLLAVSIIDEGFDVNLVVTYLSMVLSFIGMYWLLEFTGIALGLAIRKPDIVSWLMNGVSLMSMVLWVLFSTMLTNPDSSWLVYVLFALVPYIPIVPVIFLAYRFARHPLTSPPTG